MSVKLTVSLSRAAAERLMDLYADGRLDLLAGVRVLSVERGEPETVCLCGCPTGVHVFCYETEEWDGCSVCPDCPSRWHFFVREAE